MLPALLTIATTTETTETTVPPAVEVVEPGRPISDYLIDLFGLDPDGGVAGFLNVVVEPILQIIVILGAAWLLLRIIRRLERRLIAQAKTQSGLLSFGDSDTGAVSTRKVQRLDALDAVGYSIIAVVVWTIAVLTILGTTFGINLAPFLAGAGILGLAIGFGAQDLVKDFVSGLFMLAEDQYGVGDVVDVGEAVGVVEKVSLRTTRLRDVSGVVWHVPNGEIRRVGNQSQEWSRVLLDVGVAYGSDIDEASGVIKEVADEMAGEDAYRDLVLSEPEIWGVESLAADAVLIRLVIKTMPGEQGPIARELRRRIKLALDEAEIEVPFPQRTIWIRSDGDEANLDAAVAGGSGPDPDGHDADDDAGDGPPDVDGDAPG